MEELENARQETDPRSTHEAETPRRDPAPTHPRERAPEPLEAVTPYDHLWFDRRPLA